jgi:hypothetical protein
MTIPAAANSPVPNDVLHSESHSRLTPEEIAKAVARHKREHPNQASGKPAKQQKTTPRR